MSYFKVVRIKGRVRKTRLSMFMDRPLGQAYPIGEWVKAPRRMFHGREIELPLLVFDSEDEAVSFAKRLGDQQLNRFEVWECDVRGAREVLDVSTCFHNEIALTEFWAGARTFGLPAPMGTIGVSAVRLTRLHMGVESLEPFIPSLPR